jgi:malate dehydrogenase (oxaloacetate-decarboxylating)(NADP+)
MMVHSGDADMLMSGLEQHYADSLRVMLETIGPAEGVHRVSSYDLVLLPRKVRRATALVKTRAPGLVVDGEMQLATAVDSDIRRRVFRFSELEQDANVLVFPDLQSGNLALHLLQHLGEAVVVGPVLTGSRLAVQLLQYGSTVQDVVNLAAVGVVQAVGLRAIVA